MYILTNISKDPDGRVYAGLPTTFEKVEAAIDSAKTQLADDFGIEKDDIENEAKQSGTPYVFSMERDGRFEAYTVAEMPEQKTQMPTKIYGYTLTLSEKDNMGPDSITETFKNQRECIDAAIDRMKKTLAEYGSALIEATTETALEMKLKAWENICISGPTASVEIDFFIEEDDTQDIKVNTPNGTLIAKAKGAPEYPGIWICKDTDSPFSLIAAVEYDRANNRLQVTGYLEGLDQAYSSFDYKTGETI